MTQLAFPMPSAPACRACGRSLIRESRDGYGPVCRRRAEGLREAIARAHTDGVTVWAVLAAIGMPARASPKAPHPRQLNWIAESEE